MTTDHPEQLVRTRETADSTEVIFGVTEFEVGPRIDNSPIWMTQLQFAPGAEYDGTRADEDQVFFIDEGTGTLLVEGESIALAARIAVRVDAGEAVEIVAGPGGVNVVRCLAGSTADRHAPLGDPVRVLRADLSELTSATSNRMFQHLFGPETGFERGTVFYGLVPPGAAPWHFHQYEEVMWIADGDTIFHQKGGKHRMDHGSVVRILPRMLHVNENPHSYDVAIVGLITPSSSPAAAFKADDPALDLT